MTDTTAMLLADMRDTAEAWTYSAGYGDVLQRYIDRLAALAGQADAEPVAWRWMTSNKEWNVTSSPAYAARLKDEGRDVKPLYATPPASIGAEAQEGNGNGL